MHSKVRVLISLFDLGVGGAQKIAAFIADCYLDAGYEVCTLTYRKGKENVELSQDVSRYYLFDDSDRLPTPGLISKVRAKLSTIQRYKKQISDIDPDVVLEFGPDPLLVSALGFMRFKGKTIFCDRGDLKSWNPLYRVINRYGARISDCAVFQFDGAVKQYRKVSDNCHIIPNPCFSLSGVSWSPDLKNPYVMAAGRYSPDKGFDCLIDSFVYVTKTYPRVKLKIYGTGSYKCSLQQRIKERGLTGVVELCDPVRDVAVPMSGASVFVLSSEYEGLPNSLIEAMVTGVPCVSTDCRPGGARFLTKNGTAGGLIVPVGDSSALGKAIVSLLNAPSNASQLGGRGKYLLSEYDRHSIAELWICALESTLTDTAKDSQ